MARIRKDSGPNGRKDDDDRVGYGRPPKHGRIRPGEVRNPFGRNGKTKNPEDLFGKAMSKPTKVTIDGDTVLMSSEEALYMRTMAMALGGHIGAIREIQKRLASRERQRPSAPTPEEVAQEAAVLEERKALTARLVNILEEEAARKKEKAPRWRPKPPKVDEPEGGEGTA